VAFTFDSSKLIVVGVQSIVISPIQPDTNSTAYLRLVQIYTDPPTTVNRRPVLEIALYGGDQSINDQSELQITIPGGLDF
jgi:hypothetical protein